MRVSTNAILEYLKSKEEKFRFIGDCNSDICGYSSLVKYKEESITWIKNEVSIEKACYTDDIRLAVVQDGVQIKNLKIENQIIVEESKRIFFDILEHFYGEKKVEKSIGQGTYLSPEVKLGNNVKIGNNCVLNGAITIDDNTVIHHNAVLINKISIGKNCVIKSGVCIGHDGFSYVEENGRKRMIKHYGGVVIGNDVLISNNCCVERGTIDDTIISDGCRIDDLCQISHNAIIGKNVGIVAGSLIYGSAQIGDSAYIASAIVKNQLILGEKAVIGMGSVVTKDVEPDAVVAGIPAKRLKGK